MWSDSQGICTGASRIQILGWLQMQVSSARGEPQGCTTTSSVLRGTHGVLMSQGSLQHPGPCTLPPWLPNLMHSASLSVWRLLAIKTFLPYTGCQGFLHFKCAQLPGRSRQHLRPPFLLPVLPLKYSWIGSASGCIFQSLISRFQFITLSISWHQPWDSLLSPGESVFI